MASLDDNTARDTASTTTETQDMNENTKTEISVDSLLVENAQGCWNARMYPAKTLGKGDARKRATVADPVEYAVPTLEALIKLLTEKDALELDESEDGIAYMQATGIPAYASDTASWLMEAANQRTLTRVRGCYVVEGDTPETVKADVRNPIAQSIEEIVASDRGATYLERKKQFIEVFTPWIEGVEGEGPKSQRWVKALQRPVLSLPPQALPVMLKHISAFIATLGDDAKEYVSYTRNLLKSLAPADEDVWDDLPS